MSHNAGHVVSPLEQVGSGLLGGAAAYYAGKEGIEDAIEAGELGLATGREIGTEAAGMAEFRPYTVTSGLATGTTTADGGLNLNLSDEELARQQQYLGQAQDMFGGLSNDVAAGSQAIYEQMRAAQRPEEERQRMAMQQGLFSSGRGGVQQGMFGGGNVETFGFEKARQEAMLNSQLAARGQFGQEQAQMLQRAQGLQGAGYNPQQQAINLFGAGNVPASYADAARRQQGSLYGQGASGGLESFMEGQKQANELRQIQTEGMLTAATGYVNPITGERAPGLVDSFLGLF